MLKATEDEKKLTSLLMTLSLSTGSSVLLASMNSAYFSVSQRGPLH